MSTQFRHLPFLVVALSLLCIGISACHEWPSQAPDAPDQEQTVYDGGMSARTLHGCAVWQSFTAGSTGILAEIDLGFFNDMSGRAQLDVYHGEGRDGTVLQSLQVTVTGITQKSVTWNTWKTQAPVVKGEVYTFSITPVSLPDPYGLALGSHNPYSGGALGVDDPSGSHPTKFDAVFRTFIKH
jgi:hypothetical protein